MESTNWFRTAVGLAALLGAAGSAHAVDGVIEINQARALAGGVTPGDGPDFPVTISEPGSYRLTSNLEATAAGGSVEITTDSVVLDLNGFTIFVNGQGTGVDAQGRSDITVANGVVREGSPFGIEVGPDSRVENMHVIDSTEGGAGESIQAVGGGCIIRDNIISGGRESGIQVLGDGCTITGNTIVQHDTGISVSGTGCTISGNTVDNSGASGITLSGGGGCTITNNTVTSSAGDGIRMVDSPANGSLILGNTVRGSALFGLNLSADSGYADNVLTNNNTAGGEPNPPQVSGGVEIGTNLCGTDTICP